MDSSSLIHLMSVFLVLEVSTRGLETSSVNLDTSRHKADETNNQMETMTWKEKFGTHLGKTWIRERRALGWISAVTGVIDAIKRAVGVGLDVAKEIKNEHTEIMKNILKTKRDILKTNKASVKTLQMYESQLDDLNKNLDRLVGSSLNINSKLTINSIKKDFDLLYRARQWLNQQKLLGGVYKPTHIFENKNEQDYIDMRDALTNVNSYMTEQISILDNKILAAWLIENSTTCESNQYLQVLAVQATGYEWWKVLTVALCQQHDKGIGSCHVESVETIKWITDRQVTALNKQQEALDRLLLQYMSLGSEEKGKCVIKMGARLGERNIRNVIKLYNNYFDGTKGPRNAYYNRGMTPLHWAATEGHRDIVKVFIQKGVAVDAKRKWGNTALHDAASKGHLDVVKELVQRGATVDARNKYKSSPLHDAVEKGHQNVVKYLLQNGAVVDARTHNGWTPLHQAVLGGHFHIVKELLHWGASVNARNKVGWTPLRYARHGETVATRIKQHALQMLFRNMINYLQQKGGTE